MLFFYPLFALCQFVKSPGGEKRGDRYWGEERMRGGKQDCGQNLNAVSLSFFLIKINCGFYNIPDARPRSFPVIFY